MKDVHMLKTATARALLRLGTHYDSCQLFRHADRAERLARLVMASDSDRLDDANFDYLWGLSDDKPHLEWQEPGPGEEPRMDTPVVTRQQNLGLSFADGDPEKSAPYHANKTWEEFSSENGKSEWAQTGAAAQQKNEPTPDYRNTVPLDKRGSPKRNVLRTRNHDNQLDGGFADVAEIRRLTQEEELHRQQVRQRYSPNSYQTLQQSYPTPQGYASMSGA